jgi:hypothetical protein
MSGFRGMGEGYSVPEMQFTGILSTAGIHVMKILTV